MNDYVFCNLNCEDIILSSKYFNVIYDQFPVTKGHMLIISKEHKINYLELSKEEKIELIDIIDKCIKYLQSTYNPHGFNIGSNIGVIGGQSIQHFHYHIIPRYLGDMENPKGGIRGVIPNKQKY